MVVVRPWRPRLDHVLVAAVVVVFVGISGLFALGRPHFAGTDESAHLGYTHALSSGTLPTIEGAPPVPDDADIWIAERASADSLHRGVWVASHPPLHYVALVPAIWLSDALARRDGGLLFMRFGNIAAGAVGIVLTYLLTMELARTRRIAVAAAGIAGLIGLGPAVMSLAQNDGSGFAAGAFVLWACARCLGRRSHGRADLLLMGGAACVAWGVRAATMLVAVAAVVYVAGVLAVAAPAGDRLRAVGDVVLVGLVVPMLLVGWFYARNRILYGDVGASRFLLDRFGREPIDSPLGMFTHGHVWFDLVHGLTAPSTLRRDGLPGSVLVVCVAVVAYCVAVARGRAISRRVAGLVLLGIAVVVVTVAQHVGGGGLVHSRYLLPALGAIAAVLAVGLDRILPKVGPAIAVGMLAWWSIGSIPTAADRAGEARRRTVRVAQRDLLRELPGSTMWRAIFASMIVVGIVVAVAALVVHAAGRWRAASAGHQPVTTPTMAAR